MFLKFTLPNDFDLRVNHSYLLFLFCFVMPRGKELSVIEKQRIIDLRSCGKTQRQIADIICRSQSVVKNFLKLGVENYGKKNDQDDLRNFLLL